MKIWFFCQFSVRNSLAIVSCIFYFFYLFSSVYVTSVMFTNSTFFLGQTLGFSFTLENDVSVWNFKFSPSMSFQLLYVSNINSPYYAVTWTKIKECPWGKNFRNKDIQLGLWGLIIHPSILPPIYQFAHWPIHLAIHQSFPSSIHLLTH